MKHGPTNTRQLNEIRSCLRLTTLQKKILIGTILGDGCLISSRSGKAARLQIRQKAKYKEFVDWKYDFFKDWVLTKPRYDRCNDSIVFRTICHPDLMEFRKLFYGEKGKVLPSNIKEYLTDPLSLAVWFMDDGNGDKRICRLRLSTYAFKKKGNELLQNCLLKNFSLRTKIIEDCKGSYLYFLKDSAIDLYNLIKQFILPCMEYKFVKVKSYTTP